VSNTRSLLAFTRREHFLLDASLLNELSFSNFPLLHSSRSVVLCHPYSDAVGSVLFEMANSPGLQRPPVVQEAVT
jgi:hypothetical protein